MESSPACSSTGNSPAHPPAYLRLSSEVVEKPAFVGEDMYQDFQMVPEVMDEPIPMFVAGSPAPSSHSKSDSEGRLDFTHL